MSAINYLPPFANSLIMHVLTNAEKLIPLRDAASLAESRRLAGMRMVTGTTSPSTRYERISVSPASCSIKSEYVIASHAFKPQYKCINYTPAWEQRKLGDVASSFDYGLNAAATEYDGQNKYLRITDIDDETHEFSKSDLTTPLADLAMSADYLLKEGDLLFARTGASVGKTYLYRQFDGMVYFAGFLIRARIGEGADPEFAYQATLTDAYKKYVAITSQRSGQPGVNAQEYADYQLMLPSKTEQQQIGMTLRSLDDLITLHQRKRESRIIRVRSFIWLAGDISGIGVSAYQPEKRRPYDRRQHQRRNVVLRLLRAMDQRIQGRCNS
ncbi:restriction endonuclease subunit S [Bifidobacterium bifidum]|uniref:restriction endonuclease subunit S n=1 Tax=Bifidobacterium bifidum TaxID=1681 RepID=UPI001EF9CD8B